MKRVATLACLMLATLPDWSARCFGDDKRSQLVSKRGTLVCTVSRGPVCPVERVDQPCPPQPLEGMTLKIIARRSGKVFSVLTGKNGVAKIVLAPGVYRVEMQPKPVLGSAKDLPTTVTITPGATVKIRVNVDSGIR